MLTDELLNRIVTGTGRVYSHEAKDMAREVLEWRAKAAAAAKAAQPQNPYQPGLFP